MDRLDELKQKYDSALKTMTETGVSLQNLHVQDNKLLVRGKAPSEEAKARVWTAVKTVDPTYSDMLLDLTIDPSLRAPKSGPAAATPTAERTYTVQSGDTLSKISTQFYGDANQYMKIFNANTDVLSDPDKIKVGQVLKVPSA